MISRLVALVVHVFALGAAALTVLAILLRALRRGPVRQLPPAAGVEGGSPQPPRGRRRWLLWGLGATALALVLGFGGFLVAASGIVPIKASSGHWPITEWFLQFTKRRSVATHTIGMRVPAGHLDDPLLVLKGAGHYETGCRPCHGAPGLRRPRVAQAMTPAPPYLPDVVGTYDDAALFYIVKHGIKFTGMPAWPALQRDDEVWAVVAFLRAFKTVDEAGYDRLVFNRAPRIEAEAPLEGLTEPASVPEAITKSCGRCHGTDGLGRGVGAFPKLAGQREEYLYQSLAAYAAGRRHSGIMGPAAAGLDEEELRTIARYYAGLAAPAAAGPAVEADLVAKGRIIAHEGVPGKDVPPCVECHGPGPRPRRPEYPVLAGQYPEYLLLQLSLLESGVRGGTPYSHVMHKVATQLDDDQMRAAAAYYGSLRWTGHRGTDPQ